MINNEHRPFEKNNRLISVIPVAHYLSDVFIMIVPRATEKTLYIAEISRLALSTLDVHYLSLGIVLNK